MGLNKEKIQRDFGSIRRITLLTPNTFLRKIIVVSTVVDIIDNEGETAIKQVEALNNLSIGDLNTGFETVKKHKSLEEALEFHDKFVNEQNFGSCEVVRI